MRVDLRHVERAQVVRVADLVHAQATGQLLADGRRLDHHHPVAPRPRAWRRSGRRWARRRTPWRPGRAGCRNGVMACRATASGSASAAVRRSMPSGTARPRTGPGSRGWRRPRRTRRSSSPGARTATACPPGRPGRCRTAAPATPGPGRPPPGRPRRRRHPPPRRSTRGPGRRRVGPSPRRPGAGPSRTRRSSRPPPPPGPRSGAGRSRCSTSTWPRRLYTAAGTTSGTPVRSVVSVMVGPPGVGRRPRPGPGPRPAAGWRRRGHPRRPASRCR